MKEFLLKLYYLGTHNKETTNYYQKIIRDSEWNSIEPYIKTGTFLDVGCGAGYAMQKAQELGCKSFGIDPDPGGHGVGRIGSGYKVDANVIQGFAEKIGFDDNMFDTVYSSHVLEHVNSETQSLQEMARVMKNDGILIIGMPTNFIIKLGWLAQILFTTHHKIVNILFKPFIKVGKTKLIDIIVPPSHSYSGKTALYDLKYYTVKNWRKIIAAEFDIVETILPAYYPYPEYWQFFKLYKSETKSSSVFFICKKRKL